MTTNIEIATREAEHYTLYLDMDNLIGQYHPHLAKAEITLGFHFGWKPDADGRVRYMQVSKATPIVQAFSKKPVDFVILINAEEWKHMVPDHRIALLDEGLCLCKDTRDQNGDPSGWRVVKYDFAGCIDNVRRYGPWRVDLAQTARVMRGEQEPDLFKEAGIEDSADYDIDDEDEAAEF